MDRLSYLILAAGSAAGVVLAVVALFAVSFWAALLTYAGVTLTMGVLVLALSRRSSREDAPD